MSAQPDSEWEQFVGLVAAVAGAEPSTIRSDSTLVNDLDLDSLAITELAVSLLESYPESAFARQLDRQWERVTVEQLYRDCTGGLRR